MVEKEDCPICRFQLPYTAYIQIIRDWNAQPIGLEKSEALDKSKCSELEFKLISFAPMTDLKWAVELTAPTVRYVHKSCAEKMLGDRQEKVYTFQWRCPYDDLALIMRRK